MLKLITVGLLSLALLPPVYLGTVRSVYAADDVQLSCLWNLDETLSQIDPKSVVVDEPDAVKALLEILVGAGEKVPPGAVVSRVLLARIDGQPFYGLEIGGLLCAPTPFPASLTFPVNVRFSGRYAFGTFA